MGLASIILYPCHILFLYGEFSVELEPYSYVSICSNWRIYDTEYAVLFVNKDCLS